MAICDIPPMNVPALIDFTFADEYQGFPGLLYDGSNDPPTAHLLLGEQLAGQVLPLKQSGKFTFALIGHSNTDQLGDTILEVAALRTDLNPKMRLVNCAEPILSSLKLADPENEYWKTSLQQHLADAGSSVEEVQVVWLMTVGPLAGARAKLSFPDNAELFQTELHSILQNIATALPNVRQVFISSMSYTGYSSLTIIHEPETYEEGFGVKWLIQQQIDGEPGHVPGERYPWAAWGPYLWCDGAIANGEGLDCICPDDVEDAGQHSSDAGEAKLAGVFMDFFDGNPDLCPWWNN